MNILIRMGINDIHLTDFFALKGAFFYNFLFYRIFAGVICFIAIEVIFTSSRNSWKVCQNFVPEEWQKNKLLKIKAGINRLRGKVSA